MHLDQKDNLQLKSKGISVHMLKQQIENFYKGFPFLRVQKPATVGEGILKLNEKEIAAYTKLYDDFNADVLKFVPASGAASRMFSFLFEFLEKGQEHYQDLSKIEQTDVRKFLEKIKDFAFYNELNAVLKSKEHSIEELIQKGDYKTIIRYFLNKEGLHYGEKPKGVLLFHKTKDEVVTAVEEHLVEGALYAVTNKNKVKMHFTISPEHVSLFNHLIKSVITKYEKKFNVKYTITFSQQKPSTDMVAVDMQNELFRNDDGSMLFRPGGHGALIENLNDLKDDIIFIKNIDNVIPDKMKPDTILYKKALAGVLIKFRMRIFNYLTQLESGDCNAIDIKEIVQFIKTQLCFLPGDEIDELSVDLQTKYIFQILNRPIRVCGMVKNEGEPGGGPFWVKHKDGSIDLQIVESSQIDPNDNNQQQILKLSTHFNPVDLVISATDFKNKKFDLLQFRDSETGFITKKTKDGKSLQAQELPGLWNGAMAHWNTIFVEVPISTFNPVKTVNDLLRPEHQ